LDKNNRSGFDVRWRKFLDTALTKIWFILYER
jgi:hypothetical protein